MPGLPGSLVGGLHAADGFGLHGARQAHPGGKAHPDGLAGAAPPGLISYIVLGLLQNSLKTKKMR